MKPRDHSHLLAELAQAYTQHSPKSAALHKTATQYLVDGGSHAIRLIEPFPPRIVAAQGAWLEDEDGHRILDFWQGHHANILGHNPAVVTEALARAFAEGFGLQTGFPDRLQAEVAEILCRQTGAERVRFTTSGTLSTMYAILLARTFTGRDLVMKVGGGWHGAQPWGLKGVRFYPRNGSSFQRVETGGLPPAITDEVVITRFNDPDMLRDHFRQYGNQVACFIVEPFIGAGGAMGATCEYLKTARELTQEYGALLILDEVVSGFRFRAGDTGALYGVQPDLATFGKAIGGGMPVAAVTGRADIMNLVGRDGGGKVKFSGGTYSAHPASLLAAKTFMAHLVAHEDQIYPYLTRLGAKTRQTVEAAFAQAGIYARCTGYGNDALPGSSINMLLFPYQRGHELTGPEETRNPAVCDITLSEKVLQLALLLEDVHVFHGLGSVTTAHTEADIDLLGAACRRVARRFKAHL
jgi:glutamate-1-semialdehyde 2,1-aminomutase